MSKFDYACENNPLQEKESEIRTVNLPRIAPSGGGPRRTTSVQEIGRRDATEDELLSIDY